MRYFIQIIPVIFVLFFPLVVRSQDHNASARSILLKHYQAIGGLNHVKTHKSSYAQGEIIFAGVRGTFSEWWQAPLRYRMDEKYTVFSQTEGDDGKMSWSVDGNGKVLQLKDEETLKRREIKLRLEQYEQLKPKSRVFHLQLVRKEFINGDECFKVKTTNIINRDIYFDYFNSTTFYLVKSITIQPDLEFQTSYSDFRRVSGVIYPFHSETSILPNNKKITVQIDELRINKKVDQKLFAVPVDDVQDFAFHKSGRSEGIPFLFIDNSIFLKIHINGKEKLWVLDSGADKSVIDAGYAEELGLNKSGSLPGSGITNLVEFSFVSLPSYHLPGLDISPQKILSYEGLSDRFYEPTIVGILGFDFLSRFITRIDYASQTVSFYDPRTFEYKGDGHCIEAPLQDKFFIIPVVIDRLHKGKFVLDTGAHDVSLNYPYALKEQFLLKPGITKMSADLGGQFKELELLADQIDVGGYEVKDQLYSCPLALGKGSGSKSDLAGNIGNSLLRHFVIYLDYKQQRVIMEKGDDFSRKFPIDKSGMVIGLSKDNKAQIVAISSNTPAFEAGLLEGDIITGIDKPFSINTSGVRDLQKLFCKPAGTAYTLTIQRGNQKIEKRLILQDLIRR